MATTQDLTTLSRVKAYIGQQASATQDTLLRSLIPSASQLIRSFTQRSSFYARSYRDVVNSVGQDRFSLKQFPVLSVSTLKIAGNDVPATAWSGGGLANGYLVDPWDGTPPGNMAEVRLCGCYAPRGPGIIDCRYLAGYRVLQEPHTVAAELTVDQPNGFWMSDAGVTDAGTGAAYVAVASSPGAGQYAIDPQNQGGYLFNSADAGKSVLIYYDFVPTDVCQACNELVAERLSYASRIGQTSKSLGGAETTAYSLKDLPDHLRLILNQYTRVVPL
jgi:hypothetical protein